MNRVVHRYADRGSTERSLGPRGRSSLPARTGPVYVRKAPRDRGVVIKHWIGRLESGAREFSIEGVTAEEIARRVYDAGVLRAAEPFEAHASEILAAYQRLTTRTDAAARGRSQAATGGTNPALDRWFAEFTLGKGLVRAQKELKGFASATEDECMDKILQWETDIAHKIDMAKERLVAVTG